MPQLGNITAGFLQNYKRRKIFNSNVDHATVDDTYVLVNLLIHIKLCLSKIHIKLCLSKN